VYINPDIPRLSLLDTDNVEIGSTILFCPHCDWQTKERQAMVPQCPKCGRYRINMTKVDKELLDLCEDKWRRFSEIQCATWIERTDESVERFSKWIKTGDDEEAWS
jgi:ssDNA-binding Zn-finger/Zn-ribbon topoisomerase 1